MSRRPNQILIFSILISLCLHFKVLLSTHFNFYKKKLKKNSTIEFEIHSKKENENPLKEEKHRQIVEQNQNPLNKKTPKKTKYLSQFNQKVKNQMKAPTIKLSQLNKEKKTVPKRKPLKKITFDDLRPNFYRDLASSSSLEPKQRSTPLQSKKRPLLLPSKEPFQKPFNIRTSDFLKDIPKGSQTLLNTKKFIYYSYYQRIKEKLAYYWDNQLEEKIKKAQKKGLAFNLFQSFTTRIIATLNSRGSLTNLQVIEKSGLTDLDEAALNAFKKAGPFPNPPKGMMNQEGKIKIYWDFILEKG